MKWPIVINQIFSPEYWGFIDSNKTQTIESKDGFRIQVFESKSIEEAQAFYRKSTVDFSEEVYLIFDAPFYKVRIGNCVSRNEANNLQNTLKEMGYKTAWIVRSRIE
ncbi:MAG: SPOR domain-containing protein [Candidatus Marinimicrobia bacterium]|nr:SPOR domain-containing protein [Candidatus Neomarinimicrobiota bacterium]